MDRIIALPETTQHLAASSPDDQVDQRARLHNMLQLIQLRWIAVIGQITTIIIVMAGFGIDLPLPQMLQILVCLVAFNIASTLRWKEGRPVTNTALFLALLVDVATLTGQLYFSGGITNPFVFLFLLQVILSALLLAVWSTWSIVGIIGLCLALLSLFSTPLPLHIDQRNGLASLYVDGLLLCFLLNAGLLVFFITRINRNQHAANAELATLRQLAVEEDHIVRMGLLASGAAHELGTPLSTMSVILGDWRHMPALRDNPQLLDDLSEMQTQLQRCKTIVSGVLMSAGEARGESSVKTTLCIFLDQFAADWRATHPLAQLEYLNQIEHDLPVVFDTALRQLLGNLLDNAFEASPQGLRLEASRDDSLLQVRVFDSGPGFASEILANFGRPYQSTKGRPGGGLGIFFSVNVARKLAGGLTARNRPEGGALVELTLPLASFRLDEQVAHDH